MLLTRPPTLPPADPSPTGPHMKGEDLSHTDLHRCGPVSSRGTKTRLYTLAISSLAVTVTIPNSLLIIHRPIHWGMARLSWHKRLGYIPKRHTRERSPIPDNLLSLFDIGVWIRWCVQNHVNYHWAVPQPMSNYTYNNNYSVRVLLSLISALRSWKAVLGWVGQPISACAQHGDHIMQSHSAGVRSSSLD